MSLWGTPGAKSIARQKGEEVWGEATLPRRSRPLPRYRKQACSRPTSERDRELAPFYRERFVDQWAARVIRERRAQWNTVRIRKSSEIIIERMILLNDEDEVLDGDTS